MALIWLLAVSSGVTSTSAPGVRFDARQIASRLAKRTGALAVVPAAELRPGVSDAAREQQLDEFSRGCREAGAAAVCLTLADGVPEGAFAEALRRIAAEQCDAAGGFPGPCPIFVRAASAPPAAQLRLFRQSGMDALLLPEGALAAHDAAEHADLPLIAERASGAGDPGVAGGEGGAAGAARGSAPPGLALLRVCGLALNAGEVEATQDAHAAGARAVLLDYGPDLLPEGDCDQYLCAVLAAIRTKRSAAFEASAFGGLPADGSTPEKRSPKLWRRAQKEAKEIMSDSKKKYGHLDAKPK